jgi:predicted nucleic acid-binding protein
MKFVVADTDEVSDVSPDPDDDKFLACALEAQVDCIVTGDADLLSLGCYRGIDILRPREFLERLACGRVGGEDRRSLKKVIE